MRDLAVIVLSVVFGAMRAGEADKGESESVRRARLLADELLRETLTLKLTLLPSNIQLSDAQLSRKGALSAGEPWRERIRKLVMVVYELAFLKDELGREVAKIRPGEVRRLETAGPVPENLLRQLERSGAITPELARRVRNAQRAEENLERALRRSFLELLDEAQIKLLPERDREILTPTPRVEKVSGSAGINRHGVADERAVRERSSEPSRPRVWRQRPRGRG